MRKPGVAVLTTVAVVALVVAMVLVLRQPAATQSQSETATETADDWTFTGYDLVVKSNDGSRVIFTTGVEIGQGSILNVADLSKRTISRYKYPGFDNTATNSIMTVEWLDEATIGVEGHINPWIASYYTLDIANGTWSEPVHGLYFSWVNGRLIYAGSAPYTNGGKTIQTAEDNVIYTTDPDESIVTPLTFNAAGDRVAFLEQNDTTEKLTRVDATLHDDFTLTIDKRTPYEGPINEVQP